MISIVRWMFRRILVSQSAKRAWLARAVTAFAVARWVVRRFSAPNVVRVRRGDDVIVTVVPRAGVSS